MKKIVFFFVIIFLSFSFWCNAQEKQKIELTAQEIIARVDNSMAWPLGELEASLLHITPDGKKYSVKIKGAIQRENYLFKFSNFRRGEHLKILYNLNGEEIWVYNPLTIKLFNKMSVDKYDPILGTNFFFIDLSNADFQTNYRAKILGENIIVKGRKSYKLELIPFSKIGLYGKLTLYAEKDTFLPLRIDYHDVDNVVFKTMSIAQTVKYKNREIPWRYDLLNIDEGTVSIFQIKNIDDKIKFEDSLFVHQNLGKK